MKSLSRSFLSRSFLSRSLLSRSFLSLTLLATATPSIAQSLNTEVFGTIDIALAHLGGSGDSKTGLSTGGNNISRIGLRSTTDELKWGLKARLWLEAGMDSDSGTGKAQDGGLFFNRRATISLLSDQFGELRLGRDDSASFLSLLIFDPFLTNGVAGTMSFAMQGRPGLATAQGGAPIQIANAVSYFLPQNLGGFYGQFQIAFGEQNNHAANHRQGDYRGTRLGYRQGKFDGTFAAGRLYADTRAADLDIANLALSYNFGKIRPLFLWAMEKRDTQKITAVQLGATAPLGQSGVLRVSAGHYNTENSHADWNKFSLGYGHNLSRETQLYAAFGWVDNKEGAARSIGVQGLSAPGTTLGGHAHGVEMGIRHFFNF